MLLFLNSPEGRKSAVTTAPESEDTHSYDVASADATALDLLAGLFKSAQQHLLGSEPLRARSSEGTSGSDALSASEIDALRSVGLSTERTDSRSAEAPFVVRARQMGLRVGLDAGRLNQLADELEAEGFDQHIPSDSPHGRS
jgi:hypothetical protein